MTDRNQATIERAERLVRQEVHMCLSSLVSTLAQSCGLVKPAAFVERLKEQLEALTSLQEQAFELSSPVLDYEEAAQQADLSLDPNDAKLVTWEGVCVAHDLEPYEWEIFEHWAVSEWFGRQLAAQGERVDFDFAGMVVWGRTTTGQGIAMDSVVLKIAAELNKEIV